MWQGSNAYSLCNFRVLNHYVFLIFFIFVKFIAIPYLYLIFPNYEKTIRHGIAKLISKPPDVLTCLLHPDFLTMQLMQRQNESIDNSARKVNLQNGRARIL